MRKLLVFSVIILPVLIPILLSSDRNARRGLRRTVWLVLGFLVVWAFVGSRIYLSIPPDQ
ncbi:MAG TPA: hypothetical protein VHE30_29315 [Polyangiaceae bacterium]|nr:hypothetical protein [Polyangiaceae bacterium]